VPKYRFFKGEDPFQEDFGGDMAGVVQHLLRYADAPLAAQLQAYRGKAKHDYDWRLNAP
jgi:hypothetical protein